MLHVSPYFVASSQKPTESMPPGAGCQSPRAIRNRKDRGNPLRSNLPGLSFDIEDEVEEEVGDEVSFDLGEP